MLLNNAFYQTRESQASLVDMSIEHLDKQIRVNLLAPMFLAKLVLPQMLDRGAGTVVNMVSGAGVHELDTPPGAREWGIGYGTSKIGMTEIAPMLASQFGAARHPCLQRATRHRAHRAAGGRYRRRHLRRRRMGRTRMRGVDDRVAGDVTGGRETSTAP